MRQLIPDRWARHPKRDSLEMSFLIATAAGITAGAITADQGGPGWVYAAAAAWGLVFVVCGTFFYGLHLLMIVKTEQPGAPTLQDDGYTPIEQHRLISCPYCQERIFISSDIFDQPGEDPPETDQPGPGYHPTRFTD